MCLSAFDNVAALAPGQRTVVRIAGTDEWAGDPSVRRRSHVGVCGRPRRKHSEWACRFDEAVAPSGGGEGMHRTQGCERFQKCAAVEAPLFL